MVDGFALPGVVHRVHQLVLITVLIVAALYTTVGVAVVVASGVEHLGSAAILVIGDFLIVVAITTRNAKAGDGFGGSAKVVILDGFEITALKGALPFDPACLCRTLGVYSGFEADNPVLIHVG